MKNYFIINLHWLYDVLNIRQISLAMIIFTWNSLLLFFLFSFINSIIRFMIIRGYSCWSLSSGEISTLLLSPGHYLCTLECLRYFFIWSHDNQHGACVWYSCRISLNWVHLRAGIIRNSLPIVRWKRIKVRNDLNSISCTSSNFNALLIAVYHSHHTMLSQTVDDDG